MLLAYYFLLPFLGATCDRLRGWSGGPGKFPSCYTWGVFLASLFDLPWWAIPLFGFAWWAGAIPGWGYPEGYVYHNVRPEYLKYEVTPERWQIWGLADWPLLSLALRGLFWGATVLPLAYFDPRIAVCLCFGFWMPVCAWVRGWTYRKFNYRIGGSMEAVRGFLVTYTVIMWAAP